IAVDKAEGDKIKAEHDLKIVIGAANTEIVKNQALFEVAEQELAKYTAPQLEPDRVPLAAVVGGAAALTEAGEFRRQYDDLAGKLETARRTLEQAKQELVAKTAQADSAYRTAAAVYAQEYAKLQDFQSQIKECRIHAPQDGMVVYFKNESNRFNSSSTGMIE